MDTLIAVLFVASIVGLVLSVAAFIICAALLTTYHTRPRDCEHMTENEYFKHLKGKKL